MTQNFMSVLNLNKHYHLVVKKLSNTKYTLTVTNYHHTNANMIVIIKNLNQGTNLYFWAAVSHPEVLINQTKQLFTNLTL